jgi:steroid 5-alpha reductase family enzyme
LKLKTGTCGPSFLFPFDCRSEYYEKKQLMTFLHLFLVLASAVLLYMTVFFCIAYIRKDNSIVDVAWGLGFVMIAIVSFILSGDFYSREILIVAMTSLWGLRLATHIYLRNRGKEEDFRYRNWRKSWGKLFLLRSFFQIYVLQGILMLIIALPIYWVNFYSNSSLMIWDYLAMFIFSVGFFFEAVGDYQLTKFKKDKKNAGKIMSDGLWHYTRHPNYFGESLIWWGIFLMATSAGNGWYTVVSPVLITFLLLRVSGVTMLEKKYEGNEKYRYYTETTNAFFPYFPKK